MAYRHEHTLFTIISLTIVLLTIGHGVVMMSPEAHSPEQQHHGAALAVHGDHRPGRDDPADDRSDCVSLVDQARPHETMRDRAVVSGSTLLVPVSPVATPTLVWFSDLAPGNSPTRLRAMLQVYRN
jgi:hypothetical protein